MLLALLLASGSALLGGALALAVRRRRVLLELTRTFAFSAAAGVVALHLLPEALEASGVRGLLWAAVGFAIPSALEWRARSLGPGLRARGFSPARVAAELGFAALVAHSLLEGMALCAAAGDSGSRVDLEIALVAHHAPLTAAVILPFLELLDARGVALRVLAVAAAGGLGALFGGAAPESLTSALPQNIASAVMAGALLHVVADEIREPRFSARWERAADLAAALLGAGMALLSAIFGGALVSTFAAALVSLFLPCAPALLAADLIVAIPTIRRRTLSPRPGLDGFLVAMRALGIFAALAFFAIAFAGWLASTAFAPGDGRPLPESPGFARRLLDGIACRTPRRLAVFLLGGVALSLLPTTLEAPEWLGTLLAALALLFLAALSASAAAAVSAALIGMALPWAPGPALIVAALATGPLLLRRAAWRGGRRRLTGALLALFIGASAAVLLARPGFEERVAHAAGAIPSLPADSLWSSSSAAPIESVAALLLLALAFITLWRTGVRGWFAPLRDGADSPAEHSD